ncbi:MAG: OmpA family protein [Blastocatellia bacterium]|nr:OmpA family protein [Blastocatellia bacterium]
MAGREADDIPEYSDAEAQATHLNEMAELHRLLLPPAGEAGDDLDALRQLLAEVERNNELTQVRRLLVGPEQDGLTALRTRLEDPRHRAEDIAEVLAEAVVLRSAQDKKLTKALAPAIAEALTISIKKDPKALIDILFPIIGSMIRKAIATVLGSMVQSLNQTLEHSFSIQGLKWRLEARATGKPFAEVVLLHTLVYQVEQVFLIHKNTGLMLEHVTAANIEARDPDLISGMLTAIQDFVHDSFAVGQGESLETLRVGEVNVWIEAGPLAVVAMVIRGTAPAEARLAMIDAIEAIHLEAGEALEAFQGDATVFAGVRPHLESCLMSQYGARQKEAGFKLHPALAGTLAVVGVALVVWLWWGWRDARRWEAYVERLHREPGIVVTFSSQQGGRFILRGLRDPLAVDPQSLAAGFKVDPNRIETRWEPYQAMASQFVLARASRVLHPPPTVTMSLEGTVLHLSGTASAAWIRDAGRLAQGVAGIESLDGSQLKDSDQAEMTEETARLEKQVIQFAVGSAAPLPGQEAVLQEVARHCQRLGELARRLERQVAVTISGFTDETGTETTNSRLSQKRAETVRLWLLQNGVSGVMLQAQGSAPQTPVRSPETEPVVARRVSFQVNLR